MVDKDEVDGLQEGELIRFARAVNAKGGSEYSVNDTVLTPEQYTSALKEINLNSKARNFLVFQGDVESLASKDAAEMLAHFELVSGSAQFKQEYEEVQTQAEAARQQASLKRSAAALARTEKKELDAQKQAADQYTAMRENVERLHTQVALTRLFHLDAKITTEVRAAPARRPLPAPRALASHASAPLSPLCSCRRRGTRRRRRL